MLFQHGPIEDGVQWANLARWAFRERHSCVCLNASRCIWTCWRNFSGAMSGTPKGCMWPRPNCHTSECPARQSAGCRRSDSQTLAGSWRICRENWIVEHRRDLPAGRAGRGLVGVQHNLDFCGPGVKDPPGRDVAVRVPPVGIGHMTPTLQTLPSRPQLSRKRSSAAQLNCPSWGSRLAQSNRVTPMPASSTTSLGCLWGVPLTDQPLPGFSSTPSLALGSIVTTESPSVSGRVNSSVPKARMVGLECGPSGRSRSAACRVYGADALTRLVVVQDHLVDRPQAIATLGGDGFGVVLAGGVAVRLERDLLAEVVLCGILESFQ